MGFRGAARVRRAGYRLCRMAARGGLNVICTLFVQETYPKCTRKLLFLYRIYALNLYNSRTLINVEFPCFACLS